MNELISLVQQNYQAFVERNKCSKFEENQSKLTTTRARIQIRVYSRRKKFLKHTKNVFWGLESHFMVLGKDLTTIVIVIAHLFCENSLQSL